MWKSASLMADGPLISNHHVALLGQLARYGISGLFASSVNIAVYHALVRSFAFDPNLAWTVGFLGAASIGYLIHGNWSFKGHGGRDRQHVRITRFMIVSLFSFALNSLWVWLLVQHLRLPIWAPYPLAIGVTPLAVFWLNRRWVFE